MNVILHNQHVVLHYMRLVVHQDAVLSSMRRPDGNLAAPARERARYYNQRMIREIIAGTVGVELALITTEQVTRRFT